MREDKEVQKMREMTGLGTCWILKQIGISKSRYYRWLKWEKLQKKGYVHPLKPLGWQEEVVIGYAKGHRGVGYKKLTYQMLDEGVVELSPSQVYRILDREGVFWINGARRSKGGVRNIETSLRDLMSSGIQISCILR